jgi:hypothetical protein
MNHNKKLNQIIFHLFVLSLSGWDIIFDAKKCFFVIKSNYSSSKFKVHKNEGIIVILM